MIDLFGIRRRREERERLEKERIEKIKKEREKRYELRKSLISPYIEAKIKEAERIGKEEYQKEKDECDIKNSVCPKCGGKVIINRFVKIQGEIDGHSRGYSFGGSYGTMEGKINTLKVNECKACGNQWEVAEPEYDLEDCTPLDFNPFSFGSKIGFLYRRVRGVLENNEDEINDLKPSNYLECYKDTPREALEYCLYCYGIGELYGEKDLLGTRLVDDKKSPDYNHDQFLFTLKDEVWEIVKVFIGQE